MTTLTSKFTDIEGQITYENQDFINALREESRKQEQQEEVYFQMVENNVMTEEEFDEKFKEMQKNFKSRLTHTYEKTEFNSTEGCVVGNGVATFIK